MNPDGAMYEFWVKENINWCGLGSTWIKGLAVCYCCGLGSSKLIGQGCSIATFNAEGEHGYGHSLQISLKEMTNCLS